MTQGLGYTAFFDTLSDWGILYLGLFFLLLLLTMINASVLVLCYYKKSTRQQCLQQDDKKYPPISILVPTYNESPVIVSTVLNLLKLDYPAFEVIVSNDGSTDDTLSVLKQAFLLESSHQAFLKPLPHQPVLAIYRSVTYPQLIVINKQNGRKADALNAALNVARFAIYCCIDADGFIRADGLKQCIQPFLSNPDVVGVGCGLRVMEGSTLNGSTLNGGIPVNLLAAFQVLEYLRSFLLERMAWLPLNGLTLISGAFAMYKKDVVMAIGGYRAQCIGDDGDMTLRVHQYFTHTHPQSYKIDYVPEPICWTQVPTDWRSFFNQRMRWQRGSVDGVFLRPSLLLSNRHPFMGWFVLPVMLFLNIVVPVLDSLGFVLLLLGCCLGLLQVKTLLVTLFGIYSFWVFLSVSAIFIDLLTFKTYPHFGDTLKLIGLSLIQPLLYSPWVTTARLAGLYQVFKGSQVVHSAIKRHPPVFSVEGSPSTSGKTLVSMR